MIDPFRSDSLRKGIRHSEKRSDKWFPLIVCSHGAYGFHLALRKKECQTHLALRLNLQYAYGHVHFDLATCVDSIFNLLLGSGTPLMNWRPNWHRICRRKCVKWLDMKWNLRISDLGEIPKRRAPKNDADWRIRFVQNSHGEPIGDTNDKRLIKQY